MKLINFKSLALACALVLGLSSCDKDIESTSLIMDDYNKGSLTLYVYADLDLSNLGIENAPGGTKMIITANYSDYNNGATGLWADTVTVDTQGMIDVDLPVPSNGITFTITPVDFEASQTQVETNNATTIAKYWTANVITASLKPSQKVIKEITYAANNYSDYVEMVDVKLYLSGDFDATKAGNEVIPVDQLTLQSTDGLWNKVLNTTQTEIAGDGETYTVVMVTLPKSKTFNLLPFITSKTVFDTNGVDKKIEDHKYYKNDMAYSTDKEAYVVTMVDGGKVVYQY